MTATPTIPLPKALSINMPWAWLILHAPWKDVENRTWRTEHRGRLLVHAGQKWDDAGMPVVAKMTTGHTYKYLQTMRQLWWGEHLSAIIGEVSLVDCVESTNSPWFSGPHGFVLHDPQPYACWVPCAGQQRIFTVTPEVAKACGQAQLATDRVLEERPAYLAKLAQLLESE